MLKFLKQMFLGPQTSPEELRVAFKARYANFRALLTANNNALESMADMEKTLRSGHPFTMAYITAESTAVTVNVYKMIRNLLEMSEGRYQELEESFLRIREEIETIIARQPVPVKGPWIVPFARIDRSMADQVGEKMANLGEVRNRVGLNTPPGFVISAQAGRHFMTVNKLQEEVYRRLQTLEVRDLEMLYKTTAAIQQLISYATMPRDLEGEILSYFDALEHEVGGPVTVAMRSSAIGEDTGRASFAGQYRTELGVSRDFLNQSYKEILASKYSSQAVSYRLTKGYRGKDVDMCVGCLAMVDARVSGVLYTRAPEDLRSSWMIINAVPGLARAVVDGTKATDSLWVSREKPYALIKKVKRKGGGDDAAGSLSEEEISELAAIALRLEAHFGTAQDIEWSIDRDGRIIILQSRPIPEILKRERENVRLVVSGTLPPPLLAGGVTASRGAAAGPVRVVRTDLDLLRFPEGAVLVTSHPLPSLAPLLNRAVAVVSETGSIAGHLATVAREFGVPALFGIEGACEKLAGQDEITVDATGCRVYRGREAELLGRRRERVSLMTGSPVYTALEAIMKHITPLNLTDPKSPSFNPVECETLHDITRFCHEKAVIEMFRFGEEYHFNEKAGKRLLNEAGKPTEWWVINLADGFTTDHNEKTPFVSIREIASKPMLALWEGMHAFPWQGPPPVSIRGFGSVFMQSMMNPNLDPAVRSDMTDKNYFLVSKNFCNLSVRLGYHFSMGEAFLSDLLTENYVSFSFKGGAADDHRRALRVQLISAILEQYDFRVEKKGDALTARVEHQPIPFLEERLRVLGYLIMHTRQIDMAMADRGAVRKYQQKLVTDIDTLITVKHCMP